MHSLFSSFSELYICDEKLVYVTGSEEAGTNKCGSKARAKWGEKGPKKGHVSSGNEVDPETSRHYVAHIRKFQPCEEALKLAFKKFGLEMRIR